MHVCANETLPVHTTLHTNNSVTYSAGDVCLFSSSASQTERIYFF